MPLSSFKNTLGVAKVTTDGLILNSGGIDASAVSITLGDGIGTPTTAMSAIILDGPLSEVTPISAVTGSGPYTLTVTATDNAHPEGCYVLLQPTSSLGATAWIPGKTFKMPDHIDQLYDESYIGSAVKQRGVVQGLREATVELGGNVYGDTFGWVLGSLFGAEDFTGGTPNSHVFALNNQGNVQPDKYAWFIYNGINTRVVVGRTTEGGLKYDPKALIEWTAKVMARASGVVAGAATASFSALKPQPTWRAGLTIGGTYNRQPLSYEVTFTREEAENIPTINGTQDPYDTVVGALVATGKGSFVMESDAIFSDYLQGNQEVHVLAFTQGSGSSQVGVALQFSDANYDSFDRNLQSGKAYNTEDFAFTSIGNSTDANTSGGGLSPGRVTLLNNIAADVYL